ncbi:MAG: endonuclease/exonuclease/phosphatase family protein [Pirellulales bacterium]|nr:endonuclease/exonuclease/phosphatase family protein [Pirellulales bacterium]
MFRLIKLVVILAVGGAGGWIAREYLGPQEWSQWITQFVKQRAGESVSRDDAIKVASWNLRPLGPEKLSAQTVVSRLAETIRQFDVIALQGIRSAQQDAMPRLVAAVNATGAKYDFVIGPRVGTQGDQEQFAFVYNTARIEVDRARVFTVADPGNRLHREPLTALFRVRGPAEREAFTFMLVNADTHPAAVGTEQAALADVFRAVRSSDIGEDDVIMLGSFNTPPANFGSLAEIPQLNWVTSGAPTTVAQDAELENILFHSAATREFTGRGGVLDLEAQFQIEREEALQLGDRLPVWAEFSVFEGGRVGYVAGGTRSAR